jgi:hypothetical protein
MNDFTETQDAFIQELFVRVGESVQLIDELRQRLESGLEKGYPSEELIEVAETTLDKAGKYLEKNRGKS